MKLSEYFSTVHKKIDAAILTALDEHEALGARFSGDSAAIFAVMKDYARSGKMLRGILACLGSELFHRRCGR